MLLLLSKLGIAAEPTLFAGSFKRSSPPELLGRYALEAIVDDRRISEIPNVDIDGDDVSDECVGLVPMGDIFRSTRAQCRLAVVIKEDD